MFANIWCTIGNKTFRVKFMCFMENSALAIMIWVFITNKSNVYLGRILLHLLFLPLLGDNTVQEMEQCFCAQTKSEDFFSKKINVHLFSTPTH